MQTVRSGVCHYSRTQRKSNVVITNADDVWLLYAISYDRTQIDPEPSWRTSGDVKKKKTHTPFSKASNFKRKEEEEEEEEEEDWNVDM